MDVAVLRIVLRDCRADAADAFGRFVELFGEREWFFAIELGEELAIDFYIAVAIGGPHATVHGWTRAIGRVSRFA